MAFTDKKKAALASAASCASYCRTACISQRNNSDR
jgi:hypothetical protein